MQQANDALVNLGVDPSAVGSRLADYGRDISNIGGEIGSYVKNYGAEHETVEPGPVTDQEKKAAQLMGVPMQNIGEGGFFGKVDPQGNFQLTHPPIYKMSPKEIQDLNDRTLKGWGLDPAQERERAANFANDNFAENADPIANITTNNALGNWIQDTLNPKMAATKQYAAIQQTVQAQKILKTPLMHTEDEVAAAQSLVDFYKGTVGKGVIESTKDILDEIKENPGSTLAKFATQLEADPELAFLGKARVGTLLNEAKLATLTADLKKAQQSADLARRINGIDTFQNADMLEGRAAHLSQEEGKIGNLTKEIQDTKKAETLGNMASEPVIGGVANVALDSQAQTKQQGYVTKGSEAAPFVQGAALGGLAAAGEGLRLIPRKGEIPIDKVTLLKLQLRTLLHPPLSRWNALLSLRTRWHISIDPSYT